MNNDKKIVTGIHYQNKVKYAKKTLRLHTILNDIGTPLTIIHY